MRIGINTLAVNRGDFGGGERYLCFLLRQLAKTDQENQYFIFVNAQNKNRFNIEQKNFRTIICPVNISNRVKRIIYEQKYLPKLVKENNIDVFHGPNNALPLRVTCKSVLTIQYMFSFLMPKDYSPFYRRWYFNTLMKLSARKADKIISVSYSNRDQILRYLGKLEPKVTVIYHGLDESFARVSDLSSIEDCKAKYGINGDYILCVANNVLNKNLGGLIKAFSYLKEQYRIPHKLVIAGNTGFSRPRQLWLKEIMNQYPDMIHTGFIDYKELPSLYSGASVFALPSYCESFGIPLLEAMACGVPVVTSNVFAMPEITEGAALLVDPYDFKEIGDAIFTLLNDDSPRQDSIRKGLMRVKSFTWDKAAKEILQVYKEAYDS